MIEIDIEIGLISGSCDVSLCINIDGTAYGTMCVQYCGWGAICGGGNACSDSTCTVYCSQVSCIDRCQYGGCAGECSFQCWTHACDQDCQSSCFFGNVHGVYDSIDLGNGSCVNCYISLSASRGCSGKKKKDPTLVVGSITNILVDWTHYSVYEFFIILPVL